MASGKKIFFIVLIAAGGLLFGLTMAAIVWSSFSQSGGMDIGYGKYVGIVEVNGAIISSDETVNIIKKYRDNSAIKAIVLRIQSPGGGVAASQEIYQALKKTAETKPVVCSMGEVAASGGYYIACACDTIVANPGTLTGSIGVIMEFMVAEELIKKVGLKFEVLKAGQNKDLGSPFRQMTPEERALLQGMIDDVHSQFIEAVAEGRKLSPDSVKLFADGRVFSGRQALALRLVDKMGTLEDAITVAAGMAGLKEKPKIFRERKKRPTLLDLLIRGVDEISNLDNSGVRLQYRLVR
ncbi:signal peptide peptidase SppA [candidate division TA06 bacterium]|uniref:Signal peptide peptidase SppA n=1 Tax=candidate division TA06 bacterium TaxID=2250710 RepID=A0A933MKA0_UNCT6|nr:signal peptide peptidase SppA [candidate division TA06 bacterium]